MTAIYQEIGAGFTFAELRVGAILKAPNGKEVYFQPGDDTAAILETVDALGECNDALRDHCAEIALSDYFEDLD